VEAFLAPAAATSGPGLLMIAFGIRILPTSCSSAPELDAVVGLR
jgi:hypothetical protein